MQYRVTPHSTTHISPAELMFGRQIRSRLYIMKYDLKTDMNEHSSCEMPNNKFAVGHPVQFRVYTDKDNKWRFGTISKLRGQLTVKYYQMVNIMSVINLKFTYDHNTT
jgi:hypothetical protein